jgi:hypothetical protein
MSQDEVGPSNAADPARAYRSGARFARARMEQEAPLDADVLRSITASDIVVVPGTYDHVELVLNALGMPYTGVDPAQLASPPLHPEQLLVINCPGQVPRVCLQRIREFVAAGGSLFTTDWALRHIVEPAFPGVLAYNEHPTGDDVVRVTVRNHDNPFLTGVMTGADDPQWWLEGSSYPIRILDPSRVEILIESQELGQKYGETAVAVLFSHGQGEVFHMISHYYLQRTELREARHRAPAVEYAQEKGVELDPALVGDLDGLSLGEVEAASTSARLFANWVVDKKRRGIRPRSAPERSRHQDSQRDRASTVAQESGSVEDSLRDSTLRALTDAAEIKAAFGILTERMTQGAERIPATVGWQGGSKSFPDVYWRPLERIWVVTGPDYDHGRYFCGLGTQNPKNTASLTNVCQINVLFEAKKGKTAGAFVGDETGRIYLVHSGKVGGGKAGVGKSEFRDFRGDHRLMTVHWPDGRVTRGFVIGALDDENLPARIAEFVYDVQEFKRRQ